MLAIRPALCIAVSALALQGCAGVSELAGTSMVPGFLAQAGDESATAPTSQSQMMETRGPLLQSEQVMAMENSSDMGTTFIQASDPIDAPPPPIAMPAAQASAPAMAAPQPAMAPLPTPAPTGRPMMLVPAPGETMASVQPPVTAQPVMAPPAQVMPTMPPTTQQPVPAAPATSMAPPPMQAASAPMPAPPAATEQPVMMQSTAPAAPVVNTRGREFIPASVSNTGMMSNTTLPGEIPLTPGERNVLERFAILDRLTEEGLITRGERDARRSENIGAILTYSQKAPAMGLERDVPNGDAISARLGALKRSLEMRAITPRQHAVERNMILEALLSADPRARAVPKAPPADIIEAAAMIGHLERLRADGVISDSEFDAERSAIDAYFVTGSFSAAAAPMVSAGTPAGATAAQSAMQAPAAMAAPSANLGLHLASYRSQKAAEDGWTQISRKHSAQLGGLNSTIRRVELGGGRGTFYRLLAGPVRTQDQATSLCQQLKRSSQYCDPLSLGG